jgi:hypothetical protein
MLDAHPRQQPRLTACVVTEKTPEITACEPISEAMVARMMSGHRDHDGAIK